MEYRSFPAVKGNNQIMQEQFLTHGETVAGNRLVKTSEPLNESGHSKNL